MDAAMTNATRINIVEQKVGIYELETDAWLRDHTAAVMCFDLEELLCDGISLYRSIHRLDEDWKGFVFDHPDMFDRDLDARVFSLFRKWLSSSKRTIVLFGKLKGEYEARDFDTSLVDQLQRCCREVEGIVTDSTIFFSPDRLAVLRDAAIVEHNAGGSVEMKVFGE